MYGFMPSAVTESSRGRRLRTSSAARTAGSLLGTRPAGSGRCPAQAAARNRRDDQQAENDRYPAPDIRRAEGVQQGFEHGRLASSAGRAASSSVVAASASVLSCSPPGLSAVPVASTAPAVSTFAFEPTRSSRRLPPGSGRRLAAAGVEASSMLGRRAGRLGRGRRSRLCGRRVLTPIALVGRVGISTRTPCRRLPRSSSKRTP